MGERLDFVVLAENAILRLDKFIQYLSTSRNRKILIKSEKFEFVAFGDLENELKKSLFVGFLCLLPGRDLGLNVLEFEENRVGIFCGYEFGHKIILKIIL